MEVWVIEAVAVIIHPAVGVLFLARKAINIIHRVGARRRDRVSKRIIAVTRCDIWCPGVVDQHCNVAIAVCVIEIVSSPTARGITVRPCEKPADSSRAFQPTPGPSKEGSLCAQVAATRIAHGGRVGAVAFLDHPHPIVHVVDLVSQNKAAAPTVFLANSQPAPPVIHPFCPPVARRFRADQPVLIVLAVAERRAVGQIPIAVVLVRRPTDVGHLVQPIHNKRFRNSVVRPHVQVPGRVVQVTPVFVRHRAFRPRQLPDVVVIVRVIAAIRARVADALIARVVKIFALVQDGIHAVVEIRAGQTRDVVIRVSDIARVGQGQFFHQSSRPRIGVGERPAGEVSVLSRCAASQV